MVETLKPETLEQVAEAVQWAAAEGTSLDVVSSGTKATLGRPPTAEHHLDLAALAGISMYEPAELVITAGAATPMSELEAALAEKHQQLAFEPNDLGPLLGASGGASGNIGGTLAGTIACNLAGPRRVQSGAARDHLLGFHGVSGRGEPFKSGGRVIKNVTGFDLSKLIAGSFGTLAALTEITVRVLPSPEDTRTILVLGCADDAGIRALTAALQCPYEVSGAAHLPADVAVRSNVSAVAGSGGAVTAVRVEGHGPSVEFRRGALRELMAPFGEVTDIGGAESRELWREVRDVAYFVADGDRQVWKVSVPPASGDRVARDIQSVADAKVYFDWGGGLLWLALAPAPDAGHQVIRQAVATSGGHATLIRAEESVRAAVPVFQPQSAPLAALTRRVKDGFDPKRLLNPGRMYEGL